MDSSPFASIRSLAVIGLRPYIRPLHEEVRFLGPTWLFARRIPHNHPTGFVRASCAPRSFRRRSYLFRHVCECFATVRVCLLYLLFRAAARRLAADDSLPLCSAKPR